MLNLKYEDIKYLSVKEILQIFEINKEVEENHFSFFIGDLFKFYIHFPEKNVLLSDCDFLRVTFFDYLDYGRLFDPKFNLKFKNQNWIKYFNYDMFCDYVIIPRDSIKDILKSLFKFNDLKSFL